MSSDSRPLLRPLVPIYRLGLVLRDFQLRSGLKPVRRLRWPVISIGNLSTGGSGKTPLTIALARALASRGMHVDVLSRGYGRRSTAPARVDPSGTANEFGDEPLEIAHATQVPVYVAASRHLAGQLAEEANRQENQSTTQSLRVHLLDDGFQHRQLARDVDILLLNGRDLNDRLLPAGNLREALHAARRASVVAIPADEPGVANWVASQGWNIPIWRLSRTIDVPAIDGTVVAFCGIARPDQFFDGLTRAGTKLVVRIAFTDHHLYNERDLTRIVSSAQQAGAKSLITTEKDRIRLGALAASLPASLPLATVRLRVKIEDENSAIDWLENKLAGIHRT